MQVKYLNGVIISTEGAPGTPIKSQFSKSQFISLLPASKIREIQAAAQTNDAINAWIFQLTLLQAPVDLNDLPVWFTAGIQAMVTAGIFTQNQVNKFLEL